MVPWPEVTVVFVYVVSAYPKPTDPVLEPKARLLGFCCSLCLIIAVQLWCSALVFLSLCFSNCKVKENNSSYHMAAESIIFD